MAKNNDLRREQALEYHASGRPGKIEVVPTKEAKPSETYRLLIAQGLQSLVKKFMKTLKRYTNTQLKEI